MINAFAYVFFALFVLVSLIEIIAAFNAWEKVRMILKPFSLFFLGIAAIITLPSHPLIYIGAFLGMTGDIFLLFPNTKKLFLAGSICFLLGHFAYISEILFVILRDNALEWWFYAIVGFMMLLWTLAFYPIAKKITKDRYLSLSGNVYLFTLVLVSIVSLIASVKGFTNFMILGVLGGLSFLASDLILVQSTFVKDFKRKDYYIMLFYLLGQAFIVTSLVLTNLY